MHESGRMVRRDRKLDRDRAVTLALGMSAIILTGVAAFLIYDYIHTEEKARVKVTGDGHEVDTSAVWTMYRSNPMHDGLAPEGTRIPTDLRANWKSAELNFEDYSASKSSPAVDTDRVFIGADTGKLHAVWRENGTHCWDFQVRECSNGVHSAPAFDDEHVYVGAYDGWLYCLDKDTGELVWESDLGDYIGSSPVLHGDGVYIGVEMGAPAGYLVGCHKDTGEEILRSRRFGSHPHSTPSVDPSTGYMFIGSNDDNMYCYDTVTGDEMWVYETGGDIKSTPCVAGDRVLITSWDFKLHCVDIATGDGVWEYRTGARVMSSPSVWLDEGLVYVGSHDKCVHCVRLVDGESVWKFETGASILSSPTLVIDSGFLLIGSHDDHLYLLGLRDGDLKEDYRFESSITSVPVATGNSVYIFTNEGFLYEMS